jgi:hypothetical protein
VTIPVGLYSASAARPCRSICFTKRTRRGSRTSGFAPRKTSRSRGATS